MTDLLKAWDAFQHGPHPDVDGAPMGALHKAIKEQAAREHLVQEVIRLAQICESPAPVNARSAIYTLSDLVAASINLAGWKP